MVTDLSGSSGRNSGELEACGRIGPVAATVREACRVPESMVVSKKQVSLVSTRSRHPSVGMATARGVTACLLASILFLGRRK
jgi:hypothetical protein